MPFEELTTNLALVLLLAASTLLSEDLTCVGAGLLVAGGEAGFAEAVAGCLLGIFGGDLLLFLAGRYLGRPALRRAPLKWMVGAEGVERSSAWLNRRGPAIILSSRFLPGTRLPTYFAAGLLDTDFRRFALYLFLAAAVWTPLLVGLSALLGARAATRALAAGQSALVGALIVIAVAFVAFRFLARLSSWRGRRLLVSRWRRLRRWEFWPPWAFYPPVVAYVLFLGLRHRGLTLFTCANPSMPAGGFVGESKMEILRGLSSAAESARRVARAALLPGADAQEVRLRAARRFMSEHGLTFPVVLKPDAGQRGRGVEVVRAEEQLEAYLLGARRDVIIQEYVPGLEFGVFYYREPGEERGHIFSVTEKRFPSVEGDARATLEELILKDERAVCMARTHLRAHRARLHEVPAAGERVPLVELGTHCRGALFLDGRHLLTPELAAAVDRLARSFAGFHFGRFDLRAGSLEEFRRGEGFKVVELNGVTSEATHIYDPANSLLDAYRVLCEQWRLAFRVGARNRARGARPAPLRALLRMLLEEAARPGISAPLRGYRRGGRRETLWNCPGSRTS